VLAVIPNDQALWKRRGRLILTACRTANRRSVHKPTSAQSPDWWIMMVIHRLLITRMAARLSDSKRCCRSGFFATPVGVQSTSTRHAERRA